MPAESAGASRKLVTIILGASTFPYFPPARRFDNPSFARSAAAFRDTIENGEILLPDNLGILDLFDSNLSTPGLVKEITNFLREQTNATDVIIYYCGHGRSSRSDLLSHA